VTVTFEEFGMLKVAPLIALLPLLSAIVAGAFGPRQIKSASHWPVIFGVGGAFLCSLILAGVVWNMPSSEFGTTYQLYSWIAPSADVSFDINFLIDPLTAVMLVMVTGISTLVVIYSRDYMREHDHPERGYERFFAFLGLFVFSMCTLVLSGNFLLLYLGWEAVGLCSYLLIGFYYGKPAAADAAKKAFLVNRIGDFGFALGIMFLYLWLSPLAQPGESVLNYTVAFSLIDQLETWQCTTIALLLFCGAVGKSAQLPLYVWLPDAMEGPTPVSALIHAATMVTAGVYMVVRCGAIFVQSPTAMMVVAIVGAATALYAATIALAQYDMKRILAYSTVSQLGYMFLGAGVLAADSAIFHLFTHAFFKALLFLGAGSVMHAMGGVIDVRRFGGLRRVMPYTFATFVIGSLALSGFPLLSGFFSKDEIIHAAFKMHWLLGGIGLLTAILTAFYTFRMVFMAFAGETRVPEGVHAHESGKWMVVPLVLLSIGAIGAGYTGVKVTDQGFLGFLKPHAGVMHTFLGPVVKPFKEAHDGYGHGESHAAADAEPPVAEGESSAIATEHDQAVEHAAASAETKKAAGHGEESYVLMYVSAVLAILGIVAAYLAYVKYPHWSRQTRDSVPEVYTVLHRKYYVDEMNDAAIVKPLYGTGELFFGFDRLFIDGAVNLVAFVPRTLGAILRPLQDGQIQSYGVTMTAGLAVVVLIVLLVL
jgi:NADH-quinone oxidoreductase subunit L